MLALAGVLMTMRQLNQPKGFAQGSGFLSFFSGNKDPHAAAVNLCPTRITRLEAGHVAVFQDGMDWYRTSSTEKERLDPVAVEKWFSRNCALEVKKTSASADVTAALKVFFVSGEPQTLLKSASGEFEWMGQPFISTHMDKALNELVELPVTTKPR